VFPAATWRIDVPLHGHTFSPAATATTTSFFGPQNDVRASQHSTAGLTKSVAMLASPVDLDELTQHGAGHDGLQPRCGVATEHTNRRLGRSPADHQGSGESWEHLNLATPTGHQIKHVSHYLLVASSYPFTLRT
jgi:hypothetical protein